MPLRLWKGIKSSLTAVFLGLAVLWWSFVHFITYGFSAGQILKNPSHIVPFAIVAAAVFLFLATIVYFTSSAIFRAFPRTRIVWTALFVAPHVALLASQLLAPPGRESLTNLFWVTDFASVLIPMAIAWGRVNK
jgi:hypothetical protein